MSDRDSLTTEQANAVYDILVKHVGAPEDDRYQFVYHETTGFCSEYRFGGVLGFGGKFWRDSGRDLNGDWSRDLWYVNFYNEDKNTERQVAKDATNVALTALQASYA